MTNSNNPLQNREIRIDDKKYRYPGTRHFETAEKDLFFGREEDKEKLFQHVLNEKTILLYAKSGLGKSSLINAGVLPKITELNQYEVIKVNFGNFNAKVAAEENKYEKPLDKLIANIPKQLNPISSYLEKIVPNENSLWYRFKQIQSVEKEKTYLFIFDQFEELFTYPEEDIFHFKKQFANLLFVDIPSHIRKVLDRKSDINPDLLNEEELKHLNTPLRSKSLFAIRSDRMSELNRISDYFPNILKSFYELKALSNAQAEEAIRLPAQNPHVNFESQPFQFTDDAVQSILHNLAEDDTESIESFQLQMVCRYAEELIINEKTKQKGIVSKEDLGDIKNIFAQNYQRILSELPKIYVPRVRVLIEEKLIVSGNRVPLPEILILDKENIPIEILEKLLDTHFLRADRNSTGGRSIELSHDTLIAPVLEAYQKRQAEEKRAAEERERIENERKAEAKRIAEERARIENEQRLEAELKKEKAAKAKQQKLLNQARIALAFAVLASVIAVILAINASRSEDKAKESATAEKAAAEEEAKNSQRKVEQQSNILRNAQDSLKTALQSAKEATQNANVAKQDAIEQAEFAEKQQKIANIEKNKAEDALKKKEDAEKATKEAEKEKEKAENQNVDNKLNDIKALLKIGDRVEAKKLLDMLNKEDDRVKQFKKAEGF